MPKLPIEETNPHKNPTTDGSHGYTDGSHGYTAFDKISMNIVGCS